MYVLYSISFIHFYLLVVFKAMCARNGFNPRELSFGFLGGGVKRMRYTEKSFDINEQMAVSIIVRKENNSGNVVKIIKKYDYYYYAFLFTDPDINVHSHRIISIKFLFFILSSSIAIVLR